MRRVVSLLISSVLLGLSAAAAQDVPAADLCQVEDGEMAAFAPTNEAKAILVLNSLQTGDTSAAEAYVSADTYIQHNLSAPDGREGLLGLIPAAAQGGAAVNIRRVLAMGDLVALHSEYDLPMMGGPLVAFDIFRFENGQIVEHWDNLIPRAEQPNPSGHTQTDGPIAITDLDQTQANCNRVVEFITRSLIAPDPTFDITQFVNPASYTQHNPMVGDGLAAFGGLMQQMAETSQVMGYTQIHLVVAQGNFVLTASEGVFGDAANPTPTAFYDLFRLEDGLIVEHWDVIAPIPPQSEWQNPNGKF
jgi:predicted SnoaL-like aldol condensation-catalyzing enzyme